MAAPWDKDTLSQAIKQDPTFCQKCPTLAADIISRRLELVKLVEFLKEFLTDTEPVQRAVGVQVLASVLKELPPDFLSEDEIHFIVAFFCDRLKDHHDVIPATLYGILAILKMKNLPKESPALILNTLMLNINCQSQRQEDRLSIYRIIDLLVIPHIQNLQNLGPDLVYHVISAIDGERDPRNLMFLFSMLPNILRGLTLGHLTEDCFEVVACYFPVDFKPAANDPNQLTREDLAFGLADCLTAVPAFTEFCIPLLLEKLDSPLRLAKLDALYLLRKGCSVFPAEEVAVHLSPLWISLSREALSGADLEVRREAQTAITQLLRCFSDMPADANKKADPMRQLLNDIISASTSAFNEVHTSLFTPASELLLAAAESGSFACGHILKKVIPVIVEYFQSKSESAGRSVYLSIISRFLALCKSHGVIPQELPDISIQWGQIVEVYLAAAEHEAYLVRREALTGLSTVASTLNSSERPKLYDLLGTLIDKEEVSDVRDLCKLCLLEIGSQNVSEVSDYFLAKKLMIDGIHSEDARFERRLEAQCCLAALQPFSEKVLPKVIDLVVLSKDSHQFQIILTSLRKLLLNLGSQGNHVYESMHRNSVVPALLNWWVSNSQDDKCIWADDEVILNEVSLIISNVSRNLKKEEQEPLVQQILPQFYPGSDSFRPCAVSSPKHHLLTVPLFEAIIGSLHSGVVIANIDKLCSVLTELAVNCALKSTVISASRLCATLLNKMTDDKLLEETLANINMILETAHAQPVEKSGVQAAAMRGWIIKGLAMRGYKHLEKWVENLVDVLGDNRQAIALSAAEAFHIIVEDDLRFLNSESHCTFRMLYKQRVFVSSLKLITASRQAPVSGRTAYVVALTHLLSGVPETVLTNYLGEVLPLLLESLAQDSLTLLEAALSTLNSLLGQPVFSDSLKDHIQSMVPRLLPLTSYQTSMKVRRSALNCLSQICSLPSELLLPFKDEVVTRLEVCLDDPKRLVRKDAVKARFAWIMLAAPGSK